MKLTVDVQQWLQQENGKATKVKIAHLRIDKTKERGQIRSINYDGESDGIPSTATS